MAGRLAVRRPTESSKGLAVAKEKALSAATLTRKTNCLVSDVEALKNNLKDQSREVEQRDEALQELTHKVDALQNAFTSLSDVFTCEMEELQQQVIMTTKEIRDRIASIEKDVAVLQAQVPRIDGKRRQLQDSTAQRFTVAQETFSKMALSLYEIQAELGIIKNTTDHLMTREREATQLQQTLQTSQEQAVEWFQKLRQETSQMQTELYALKEEATGASVALASDIKVIAKENSTLRSNLSQQHAQWLGKLDILSATMDRQAKMDKSQWMQRLDTLSDNLATYELRTNEAVNSLLKNHSRIRTALDEGMTICSSEIRTVSSALKTLQTDQQEKMDELMQQLTTNSIEWVKKHEELQYTVRSMALELNVTI